MKTKRKEETTYLDCVRCDCRECHKSVTEPEYAAPWDFYAIFFGALVVWGGIGWLVW